MTTEPETTETPTETIPPFNEPGPPQQIDFMTVYPYLIAFCGSNDDSQLISSQVMELPVPLRSVWEPYAIQADLTKESQTSIRVLNFQALEPFEKAIPLTPPPPPAEPLTPSA